MINIYVGNLPYKTSEADLVENFSRFGEVRRASIVVDRETGRSRGFGFVEMMDRECGLKAIEEMAGAEFKGRPMTINEARPRGSGTTGGPAGFASTTGLGSSELADAPLSDAGSAGYSNAGLGQKAPPPRPAPTPATDADSPTDAGPPRDVPRGAEPEPDDASTDRQPDADADDASSDPPSSGYSNSFLGN